ncbi:FecR family protein [Mucilaginibacter lappiensis]|uniref:FecR family protein n=1 Tax=Mucilaginibacter lappiensis TaxID=354630 RepID=UPI003D1A9B4D
MNKDKLKRLLHQYFNNAISDTDCIELLDYLGNHDSEQIADIIDEQMLMLDKGPKFNSLRANKVLEHIKADPRFANKPIEQINHKQLIVKLYHNWIRVAALIIFFSGIGFYFLLNRYNHIANQNNKAVVRSSKILPGSNKATLTLANGKVILLDSIADGMLAKSGRTVVNKAHKGELVYNTLADSISPEANAVVYNTLSTPRGGQYQLKLPDGTRVWLNSSSSISYPIEFTGNERRVKLTGEAYFEVAKNKEKPFYVSINNKMQVKVLGTHFNIAAYNDDEELTTTLLEGAVQISKNNKQCLLKPGQQAVVSNRTDVIAVSEANVSQAIAWKNGYFVFNDESIVTIMKKVSRWYDADIEYQGNFENQRFGGTFYRSKSINELLHHLEKIGKVHFKITGRRITVME